MLLKTKVADQICLISKEDLDDFTKTVLNEIKAIKEEAKHARLNYMRSSDVMEELGISSSHLQNMRIKGNIPFTTLGDTFFYPREEISSILQNNSRCTNPYNNNRRVLLVPFQNKNL